MSKIHFNGLTNLLNDDTILANQDDSLFAAINDQLQFGTNVVIPLGVPTVSPYTNTLYLTEAGNSNPISYTDINQDQLGDCFLVSPIGEIAMLQPTYISNMIHLNSNGTETVTLYESSTGRIPGYGVTSFKPVTETVTNIFPAGSINSGATQDVVGKLKEIWPQVIENAVAQLDGGYNQIANGGYPTTAMEELTGQVATAYAPQNATFAFLTAAVSAGDMITFDTVNNGLSNGLYGNHCYMFQSMTGSGSSAVLHLANPWGVDQPTAVSLSNITRNFCEVDICKV
jgi:hypothetical protein